MGIVECETAPDYAELCCVDNWKCFHKFEQEFLQETKFMLYGAIFNPVESPFMFHSILLNPVKSRYIPLNFPFISPEIPLDLTKSILNPMTGWWSGTFFIFPYIGNNHPNWLIPHGPSGHVMPWSSSQPNSSRGVTGMERAFVDLPKSRSTGTSFTPRETRYLRRAGPGLKNRTCRTSKQGCYYNIHGVFSRV